MEKIKPCPFCGSNYVETKIVYGGRTGFNVYAVNCIKCGAASAEGKTKGDAIAMWNAMPRREDSETERTCENCRFNLDGNCSAVPPYKTFRAIGKCFCANWEAKEPEPAPLKSEDLSGKPFIDLAQDELDVIRTLETKVNEYQMAAEEAAELAQAMLKYCRVYGHGSYTPMNPKDAMDAVIEEYADLLLAMEASFPRREGNKMFYNNLERVYKEKAERWAERLKEQEGEEDDRDDQF